MNTPSQGTPPTPPAWVERGVRVTVNGSIAVVTHVSNEWSGERNQGPVYLRPEQGGPEFTAEPRALRLASGPRFDERLSTARTPAASRRTL